MTQIILHSLTLQSRNDRWGVLRPLQENCTTAIFSSLISSGWKDCGTPVSLQRFFCIVSEMMEETMKEHLLHFSLSAAPELFFHSVRTVEAVMFDHLVGSF